MSSVFGGFQQGLKEQADEAYRQERLKLAREGALASHKAGIIAQENKNREFQEGRRKKAQEVFSKLDIEASAVEPGKFGSFMSKADQAYEDYGDFAPDHLKPEYLRSKHGIGAKKGPVGDAGAEAISQAGVASAPGLAGAVGGLIGKIKSKGVEQESGVEEWAAAGYGSQEVYEKEMLDKTGFGSFGMMLMDKAVTDPNTKKRQSYTEMLMNEEAYMRTRAEFIQMHGMEASKQVLEQMDAEREKSISGRRSDTVDHEQRMDDAMQRAKEIWWGSSDSDMASIMAGTYFEQKRPGWQLYTTFLMQAVRNGANGTESNIQAMAQYSSKLIGLDRLNPETLNMTGIPDTASKAADYYVKHDPNVTHVNHDLATGNYIFRYANGSYSDAMPEGAVFRLAKQSAAAIAQAAAKVDAAESEVALENAGVAERLAETQRDIEAQSSKFKMSTTVSESTAPGTKVPVAKPIESTIGGGTISRGFREAAAGSGVISGIGRRRGR